MDVKENLETIYNFINEIKDEKWFRKAEVPEKPFNIILSSSDRYYMENFHSDILASILEKKEFFLLEFINFLNKCGSKNIDNRNYKDYKVVREQNRIDILIYSESTKHCIIVENKINNAKDMKGQIPRYVKAKEDDGFTVDVIVYLSLDGNKQPIHDEMWDKYYEKIKNHIICIPAFSRDKSSLTDEYLLQCLQNSNNTIQESAFLSQYIDLLKYLGMHEVNTEIMSGFYEKLMESNGNSYENYNTIKVIKDMIKNLTDFRRKKFYQEFQVKHEPFNSINEWSNGVIFEGINEFQVEQIKFEVYFTDEESKIIFKSKIEDKNDPIAKILFQMKMDNKFQPEFENAYSVKFNFPENEKELYDFVSSFLENLNKLKGSLEL